MTGKNGRTNRYDHKTIEKKWQKYWADNKTFEVDLTTPKDKFYNLFMFPYPSAEGMHAGHVMSSTGSDIYGKYQRMLGKNVFQPMGYDSFGIHSENFAIKIGQTPQKMLARTTKHFGEQFKSLGHGYDWSKQLSTSDIDYYTWTQWMVRELFKAGLAYRKKAKVNWCPSCKTVLADEQVVTPSQAGKTQHNIDEVKVDEDTRVCERCGTVVEKKDLEQWFLRITDYADRLLDGFAKIDWTEKVKIAQKNWIGKSKGLNIHFTSGNKTISVWTKFWETVFGTTFLVVAPEYARENLMDLVPQGKKNTVEKYIKLSLSKSENDRKENKQKSGVDMGFQAVNPANGESVPVFVADYVLMDVGTGAVMGVPVHDDRDFEFAKKYDLAKRQVVEYADKVINEKVKSGLAAFEGEGKLINSGKFTGLAAWGKGKDEMAKWLVDQKMAEWKVDYHLRDWLVSRQRYWGPPIPFIYCPTCAASGKSYFKGVSFKVAGSKTLHASQDDWNSAGWYPEEKLPVKLPDIANYAPEGEGRGPLAKHPEFYETKCPECGGPATRETDVLDAFVDSSWYFLRYPSVDSKTATKLPFDPVITKDWLPADLYFGGAEHSVLHLMYARFVTMALYDLGYVHFQEPFPKFFAHGLMIKDGAKMSKSRGNVVNPDEYVVKFGADTLRLYVIFMGPITGYPDFRDTGIEGMARFVGRIWDLVGNSKLSVQEPEKRIVFKRNETIKSVTEDITNFRYNTAIASLMEYVSELRDDFLQNSQLVRKDIETLAKLLAPFAPHIAEEIWQGILGNKETVHKASWPHYDERELVLDTISIPVQVNGKLRATLSVARNKAEDKEFVLTEAKKDQRIQKWVVNGIKKDIFIPGKLLNLVV